MDGQDVTRSEPAEAQHQPRAPVLRQLPAHDGVRQHRLAAAGRAAWRSPKSRAASRRRPTSCSCARCCNRRPQELSGGQQQRTALARAIAKECRAVFLDEPLANLDYKLREELRDQLPELFAGRGAVVVYATSEPEEALMLGGKTALMHDGRVTQFGPTAEIYRHPAT